MQENKQLKDTIEDRDVTIEELEATNKTRKEISDKLNRNLNDLKVKHNKEKMELSKKYKAEIKYWRKQLGEQTKMKIKLEEQLQDGENNEIVKPTTTKKKLKKQVLKPVKLNKNSNSSTTSCSICSLDIPEYVPEYFCGEKFNPTCESCKDKDFSDDLFSSFSSPQQPVSLASHWLVPLRWPPPQNPHSIPSLVSHCVKAPSPVEEKLNDDTDRADFKEWLAEFRDQMKADRIKFIAELRKDLSSFKFS